MSRGYVVIWAKSPINHQRNTPKQNPGETHSFELVSLHISTAGEEGNGKGRSWSENHDFKGVRLHWISASV